VIDAYAALGFVTEGAHQARSYFSTIPERNTALKQIAETVTTRDAFPDCPYALVDTDRDGKPDFFFPWATAAQIATCGLELDDDSDGDGKLDINDPTPFFADPGKYE
jgi:hypothetical protein